MNKMIKRLLIAALAVGASASAHTNKTHMTLRNQALRNLPLEQTTTKERITARLEDRFGGTFHITGFYGQNAKASEIGKYFGFDNKNVVLASEINAAYNGDTTIKLSPEIISYGAVIGYNQELSKLLNGLSLKITVPVVHASNDLKMVVNGTSKALVETFFKDTLTNGKINGQRSTTGVADIDMQLGYKFLDKEAYNASINIGGVIPTGNELKAVYAFEPQVGSKNWGLGAGLEAQARVLGDEDHNLKLNFATNYRYMFQASEKRMLGLKDVKWAQYKLVGGLPVANSLTKDVNVALGSQLDNILGFAYNNGGLTVDLGYNMYFAEQESVKIKGTIANVTIDGAASASVADATAAENQTQFTNGVYAGLGYAFKEWEYPLFFGVGGKYDVASKNSAPDFWQAWIKAGVSF